MLAALKFFLGQDDVAEDSDDDDNAEEAANVAPPTREEVYKATKKVQCVKRNLYNLLNELIDCIIELGPLCKGKAEGSNVTGYGATLFHVLSV